MSTALTYRPDIDGLRAVSVLAVIFFHAGLGFPGGFVGVDVFFVISGFLITSLIIKDLDAGTFSLARFWSRRIKRIWPAAMTITLVSLVTGYFLLLPQDYVTLSRDAIAQTCMLANVEFALTVNYFHGNADLRPLLHTWSLAVEEQFYVAFPVVLMVAWRFGRPLVVPMLVLGWLASLGLSVWGIETHPRATFYLLPTRTWELMTGSLLAVVALRPLRSGPLSDLVSFVGLGMIIASSLLYTIWLPFPGLTALPPCLGAAMVIYAGQSRAGWMYRALSIAPMRVTGLMSYSLYLWHWPILAYMRYTMGYEIPLPAILLALLATGLLSYFSWRYIETPSRKIKDSVGLPKIAGVAALASFSLIGVSMLIHSQRGLPERFDQEILQFGERVSLNNTWNFDGKLSKTVWDAAVPIGAEWTEDRPVDFLLWGDSHAQVISQTVHNVAARSGVIGAAAIEPMSAPLPGTWRPTLGDEGVVKANRLMRVMEWIKEERPRNVILCARWSVRVDGRPHNGALDALIAPAGEERLKPESARRAMREGLERVIETCDEFGITVWILTEPPYQPAWPQLLAIQASLSERSPTGYGVDRAHHEAHQESVMQILGELEGDNFRVVSLAEPFFDEEGRSIIKDGPQCLYYDEDHLNSDGAERYLSGTFEEILRSFE